MNIVQIFDPTTTTTDSFTVPSGVANGKMVVWNESNISLTFSFQNGDSAYVPAWCAVVFCAKTGNVNINWEHQAILSSSGPPLSQVVVELYHAGEELPGQFPMALNRQTNTGNVVQTVTSGALFVQNDGNVLTNIVEATPIGDATSAVVLTNTGVFTLGNTTHHGSISSDNGAFTTDGSGNLTVASLIANSAQIANAISAQTFTAQNAFDCNQGGTTLFGSTAGSVTIYQPLAGSACNLVLLFLAGFRNGGASAQTLSIPVPFTQGAKVWTGAAPSTGIQLTASGVAQTVTLITALASGGGTGTGVTTLHSHSIGEINVAFDKVSFPGSAVANVTGVVALLGA